MKRFFLSFVSAVCMLTCVNAQKMEFQLNGTKVEDGATLDFNAIEDGIFIEASAEGLKLVNLSGEKFSAMATYEMAEGCENTLGAVPSMCIGSMCRPGFPLTLDFTVETKPMDVQLHIYDIMQEGSAKTKLTVFDAANQSEAHTIYVNFIYSKGGSGVEGVSSGLSLAAYDVYGMNGMLIRKNVPQKELSSLTPGLYIMKDMLNGNVRKMVIK
ncbi:hypothetical protein [Xylanibacter muris]|uniref:T9SS type A sorting domain-containing protein n=1 Tax=Xylanibacter muris TaxID=2736290 RepID=A0ABX2APR1_9BACT|nr:hypothetical protein [Xylanibacter muris]NPD91901.1 hypothetical protein [Xylanibacter muris]